MKLCPKCRDARRGQRRHWRQGRQVCSDSRLSAMDDELGRLYKGALAGTPNNETLKSDQKAWLSLRDRCRDSDCIKKAYADRISALKGSSAGTSDSVTGTYKMK